MKNRAVVFDFDGTLLDTGPDKGVHILYSVWAACFSMDMRLFYTQVIRARTWRRC